MRNFGNLTALLNIIGWSAISQEFIETLTNITLATSLERRVNTILYTSYAGSNQSSQPTGTPESSQILYTLSNALSQPLLHLDTTPPIHRYTKRFNAELLSIAKLKQRFKLDIHLLKRLWRRLWRNRQSRLILLFEDCASDAYVELILQICEKNRATNVIALQPRRTVMERTYWTLRIFPKPKAVKRSLPAHYKSIFPKHLQNMHGHPLRLVLTSFHPQIYTYTPANGNATLSGFLGRAIAEYATHHNATVEYTESLLNIHKMFTRSELIELFENNSYDIGSLVPIDSNERDLSFSVVFQRSDWCLMVPVEQPLPKSTFYYKILDKTIKILFCVCFLFISVVWSLLSHWENKQPLSFITYMPNFSVLQGLMGMSFWTNRRVSAVHKIISVTVSWAGVIVSTTYTTYLQSFTINAPIGQRINTIEELLRRGIKLAITREDLSFAANNSDIQKYMQNFTVYTNFTEYVFLRDSLDTRYAFPVTDIWAIYDEQQKYFSRPLFRFSNMCFGENYPMVLPLQESSVHRQRLNEFLEQLHEAGLVEHWRRHSFVELVEMHWFRLEDRNKKPGFEPVKLQDLHGILTGL
ncbi:PREDICTED: uncharacterized protein LOC108377976, partial [Rhagoletis zephyria]|uniref:uncharacterized protein LOC108377976 n=1 Tax=Rhagoletis zephyria TaxID=28612 RepID=UPI0008115E1B